MTRDSVLQLAKNKFGYKIEEKRLSIKEICEGIKKGTLTEAFGSGTAASITPVGELYYNEPYIINEGKVGKIAQQLYDEITGIQTGKKSDDYGWIDFIDK
ncbi:MAG: hypothetical protein ACFFBD_25540 [Candidatus Hodarchaeota archaeon]